MNYGKLINYTIENGTLRLDFEKNKVYLRRMASGIINFTTNPDYKSYAVILPPIPSSQWNITEDSDKLIVKIDNSDNPAKNTTLHIYNDFFVDIFENGELICSDYRGERKSIPIVPKEMVEILNLEGHEAGETLVSDTSVEIVKAFDEDDAVYGLGDKPGSLNKRGYTFENWNTDDPSPHVDCFRALYKSIPFFIILKKSSCYGIFTDNTYRSLFDFGNESSDYYFICHANGDLNYYYISGDNMAEIVSKYVDLTGHAVLPQRWLFGYHQSRWSYGSDKEVRSLADKFRALDIPLDCIHLDIDYMRGYRVFTFDYDKFPTPRKLADDLAKQGIKLITIIDPGVKKDEGYSVYDEGIEMDAFAHDNEGNVYENAVWPGTSVFPDFSKKEVRDWWGDNIKVLTDAGIRGIWNDMNEPASFNGPLPDDVRFVDGTHDKIHNVYGHLMAEATYNGLLKNDPGRRPFVLTRACYAGSGRYCGGWTGDNHSLWDHIQLSIQQMCSLGISGMMMVGSDVGGFGSDTTPELFVRFYQAALFNPFYRNHAAMGVKRQEPWVFHDDITDIIRKTIKLRYRFLPYIYDLAHECVRTGAPIMRPMVFEYPYDPNVRNLADQFMVGDNLLVAPVIHPGKTARAVYLPEGKWYDFYTGEVYTGGKHILADAPLDCLPIYVKEGTILPLWEKDVTNTDEYTEDDIKLYTYGNSGTYTHYIDDGVSFDNKDLRIVVYELDEEGNLSVVG